MHESSLQKLRKKKLLEQEQFREDLKQLLLKAVENRVQIELLILKERDRRSAEYFLEFLGFTEENPNPLIKIKRVKWEQNLLTEDEKVIRFPLSLVWHGADSNRNS